MECQPSAHQAAQEDLVASPSWMTPRMKNPVFKEINNIHEFPVSNPGTHNNVLIEKLNLI
jgi:hypothetical protein